MKRLLVFLALCASVSVPIVALAQPAPGYDVSAASNKKFLVDNLHKAGVKTRCVFVDHGLLRKNERAEVQAQFDALAYSHRKEYVRRVTEAKKPETRARRIADTVTKVRAGETR